MGPHEVEPFHGVGGECWLRDAFGKPEGAPFCMGVWEVYRDDEPTFTDCVQESVAQYVIEGTAVVEMNGKAYTVSAGDFLSIPQAPDTQASWRAISELFRSVYVTYPHWH